MSVVLMPQIPQNPINKKGTQGAQNCQFHIGKITPHLVGQLLQSREIHQIDPQFPEQFGLG